MATSFRSHRDNQRVLVEMWTVDALDGDHSAAVLLSQLLWWFQPAKGTRETRVRYERDGHMWLVRGDGDWFDDCRLSAKQVRRVRKALLEKEFIVYRKFQVNGAPTGAWRPGFDALEGFVAAYECFAQTDESDGENAAESGLRLVQEDESIRPTGQLPIDTHLSSTPKTTSENLPVAADAATPIDELCDHLASKIEERNNGEGKPIVTQTWRRDMRLLVERGPAGVKGKPKTPDEVRTAIDLIFSELAERDGTSGFCWADQVNAPSGLRDKWVKMSRALANNRKRRVSRGAQSVARVVGKMDRDAGVGADAAALFSNRTSNGSGVVGVHSTTKEKD